MAINFKDMKNNRRADFEKLQKQIDDSTKGSYGKDTRFWVPSTDKAGNGFAVIRFLSAPAGEDASFVRLFEHAFKGPTGQWYIENSRTTIGEKDPVGEMNSVLWNSTDSDESPERKQARAQKRKLSYIANVLIIKDSANPDNEGKVFLYKFGKKIWDKIQGAMYPEFEDETGFNPFDLWEGANFKLKIRQVEGYRNYDKSEFDKPEPLSDDDDKLEAIWKQEHSLQEFVSPDKFKSYEELEKQLHKVLGLTGGTAAPSRAKSAEDLPEKGYTPRAARPAREAESHDEVGTSGQSEETNSESGDSEYAWFEKLAKS